VQLTLAALEQPYLIQQYGDQDWQTGKPYQAAMRACSRYHDLVYCLQGDLTDPSYFDFISFAQMATVSREIPKGQQEFEVKLPPELQLTSAYACVSVTAAFSFASMISGIT